jgi:hypothetical protein
VRDVITEIKYEVKNNPIISAGSTLSRKPRETAPVALRLNDWVVVKSDETSKDPFWVGKVHSFTEQTMKVRWYSGCGKDIEHYVYMPAVHNQDDDADKPAVPHYGVLCYKGPDAVCILDSGRTIMTTRKTLKAMVLKKIEEDDRVKFSRQPRSLKRSNK